MTLDELTPIADYSNRKKLTFKKALQEALSKKIEVYYACTAQINANFEPDSEATEKKPIQKIEYKTCELILIPENVVKELWAQREVPLEVLLEATSPEGYQLTSCKPRDSITITEEDIYVNEISATKNKNNEREEKSKEPTPSDTALKVVGLMMCYLQNQSPKYINNSKPNKSAIKHLLFELAEKENIKDYGLSTIDERLLTDAMEYLESQKK